MSDVKKKFSFALMKAALEFWNDPLYKSEIVNHFYEAIRKINNKSNVISEDVEINIDNNRVAKEWDHCFPPHVIGHYIMDNADKYLNDYEAYSNIFDLCTTTILITKEENTRLRRQTKTRQGQLILECSLLDKYANANIKLIDGSGPIEDFPFSLPDSYLDWEKQFIMENKFL
jgi:hypothetical protein